MATTIQVSQDLATALRNRKMYDKESYEDIIWDLLEDTMELSGQTRKNIKIAEREIQEGKTISFDDVKKKYGLKNV